MPVHQAGDIILQNYQIEAFIGEGGFGEVYRALDRHLKEVVALKILRRAGAAGEACYERAIQRFTLEARLGHHINHPQVIRIHRFAPDQASGLLVLVMEYLPGGSLADRLRSGPLAVAEALRLARQVAAGLGALHAQDVVHRDLKPSNILFDATGSVRVADLGLAQAASLLQLSDPGSSGGDQMWFSPGTPAYMSPEQERGQRHLQPASDIYALGLILFEMLTGRSYKNQPPETRLSTLRPDVPVALDELVAGMLSEDPRQRPWDGVAAEQALAKLSAADPVSVPTGPVYPVPAPVWTLDDGLSALAGMETAREWQLAEDLLKQLEAAYPGNPRLILPRKRIEQLQAARREPEAQAARRAAEEKAARDTAERAHQAELARKKAEAEAQLERDAADRAWREAESRDQAKRLARLTPPDRRKLGWGWIAAFILLSGLVVAWMLDWLPGSKPNVPMPSQSCSQIGQTWTSPVDGMNLVCVPAGDFLMGSTDGDADADDDEKPQHTVYLDAYWIDQTEVTNAQYARCVAAGACRELETTGSNTRNSYYSNREYADYPVIHVSWFEARAYCTWAGRQLPSEAQWEKAARGTDGRMFPWGNTFDCHLGNFNDETVFTPDAVPGGANCDGYPDTSPVGAFPSGASPYGALDMAGNVAEWTADQYDSDYYSRRTSWRNPAGPAFGGPRVVRDGSWYGTARDARTVDRVGCTPVYRLNGLGFRCRLGTTP